MLSNQSKMRVSRRGIFRNIYELNDWIYTLIGFGVIQSPIRWHQIMYRIYGIIWMVAYIVNLSLFSVELMAALDDVPKACNILTYGLIVFAIILRSYFISAKLGELKELGSKLDNNFHFTWAKTEKWNLIKRKNRRIMIYVSVGTYTAIIICWIIITICAVAGITEWFFLVPYPRAPSLETLPWFYISVSLFQFIGGINCLFNFMAHDIILYGFILRIGEHLDIIENRLKAVRCRQPQRDYTKFVRGYSDYPDDGECVFGKQLLTPDKIHVLIVQCIKHHQAINESLNIIQGAFSRSLFVSLYIGAFVLAFLTSTIIKEGIPNAFNVQSLVAMVITSVSLFTYCLIGTQLTEKFENVRFAFYSCPWYELGGNTRRMLTFVLLRLQTPGKLRAGNVADVSLETYLWILKFCYNTVTFLQNK